MKIIKHIIYTIWQLPQDIVGGVIWLICRMRHRNSHRYAERILTEWGLLSGLSLGHFIFVHTASDENLTRHEYGHTLQSLRLGWLYLFIVGIPSVLWASCFNGYRKRKKISYYSFYTERWADKLGGVVRVK